jgi:hypothetical protein
MRADGTGTPERLIDGPTAFPRGFSPDGARLIYETGLGAKTGVWQMPLDWRDPAHPKPGTPQLLAAGAVGSVSPDGKWMMYVDAPAGLPEVFVRALDGGGGPWQISSGGDYPVWSGQTRELFYIGLPGLRIMAARYSTPNDSFSPSAPRKWTDVRVSAFDVMPDGKHLVVIPSGEQKPITHAMFLFHFMDDLRRRVPTQK